MRSTERDVEMRWRNRHRTMFVGVDASDLEKRTRQRALPAPAFDARLARRDASMEACGMMWSQKIFENIMRACDVTVPSSSSDFA